MIASCFTPTDPVRFFFYWISIISNTKKKKKLHLFYFFFIYIRFLQIRLYKVTLRSNMFLQISVA